MNNKNEKENIILGNNNNIEIEYNEDLTSEKIKSLNKFPSKLNKNREFYIDNSRKNFSKSLNFNFRQCFAPISKKRKSLKNPAPLKFKKNENINKYNNQNQIIAEDALSEKEASLNNEDSISMDSDINKVTDEINNINNIQDNTNNIINNPENNNIINNENNNPKEEDINVNLNINKEVMKHYEHKTISVFNSKNKNNKDNNNMKLLRNEFAKIKLKCMKEFFKEVEYEVKKKDKNKYRLDLVKNKNEIDNDYRIITINKIDEINKNNQDEDENECQDMRNFRQTINFMDSKKNKEKIKNKIIDNKGTTIFDVLISNKFGNKK